MALIIFTLNAVSFTQVCCRHHHPIAKAECGADLKLDNILVSFEDPSILEEYVRAQSVNPMPRKVKDGRIIYLSHNHFGLMKSWVVLPMECNCT